MYKLLRLVLFSMGIELKGQILVTLNPVIIFVLVSAWSRALSTHPTNSDRSWSCCCCEIWYRLFCFLIFFYHSCWLKWKVPILWRGITSTNLNKIQWFIIWMKCLQRGYKLFSDSTTVRVITRMLLSHNPRSVQL
jgi:hypothetical protein